MQRSNRLTVRPEALSQEDYEEALLRSWLYFSGNLCEALTAKEAYNPDGDASPLTWMNSYLKWRLHDAKKAAGKAKVEIAQPFLSDEGWSDPMDLVADAPDAAIALERLRHWVETDPDKKLKAISVIEARPEITAQVVLRDRLAPEWLKLREIAERYGIAPGTVGYFWTTKVKPLLLDFLANDSELFGG